MSGGFSDLVGKVLSAVVQSGDDTIDFHCNDGVIYRLWHRQDCCEYVHIAEIIGEYSDLVATPILVAEERNNHVGEGETLPDELKKFESERGESTTWTFYTLRTIKGTVDIRWVGSSNGWYGEEVDFEQVHP